MVRKLRGLHDKVAATELFKSVAATLDKLARKNVIHKNKAGNLKSKLAKHVNALAA